MFLRRGRATATVFLSVVCAMGPVLSLVAVVHPSGTSPVPPSPSAPGGALPPFAARASYEPWYGAEVSEARPASGTVPIEVTFARALSPEGYATALAFFRAGGLLIRSADPARLFVDLQGSAAQVGHTFATTLSAGSFRGGAVLFPATPPSLPSALESEVAGVVGLSRGFTNFSIDLQPVLAPASRSGAVVPDAGNEMTPGLARQLYGFSSLYNLSGGFQNRTYPVGTSVAVLLWGRGYAPSDLNAFFSNPQDYPSSFPAPNIVAYPIDGAPPPSNNSLRSPDPRAVEELTLDTEWAASMAPGATIDVLYAPDGPGPSYSPSDVDLTDALTKAISLNVSAISMSFGTTESTDAALVSDWRPLLNAAESRGITVLAATGDTGGDSSACSGTLAPEYPASSPQVLAVGGTAVSINRPPLQPISFSETGWNDSGGGFSTQFVAPAWEAVGSAAPPITAHSGYRGMPDVSATAADNFLYFNGTAMAAAGTSFATPLWAALVADLDSKWGQSLGFLSPRLYHVGSEEPSGDIGVGLADVVGASNCVATASVGWDAVTGWGSPRADVLYDDLLGSFVNISLTAAPGTVAPGGSVTVTAQLTNRTSGAPISGVVVDLSLSADTNLGPCTGTFGSASPTTDGGGSVSAVFSVPVCYLGQHALVNASVATTKLFGSNGLRVSVNLLGLVPSLGFLEDPPWAYVTYSVIVGAAAVGGAWLGRPKGPAGTRPSRPVRVAVQPPPAVMTTAPPPTPPPPASPSGPPPLPSSPPPPTPGSNGGRPGPGAP